MSLFVCASCQTIDNSAIAPGYWSLAIGAVTDVIADRAEILCTACSTGSWHGVFPRETYDLAVHGPIYAGRRISSEICRAP